MYSLSIAPYNSIKNNNNLETENYVCTTFNRSEPPTAGDQTILFAARSNGYQQSWYRDDNTNIIDNQRDSYSDGNATNGQISVRLHL